MVKNLLIAALLMLALLCAVGLLGGIGSVELTLWVVLTVLVLVGVGVATRRHRPDRVAS
jgi:hypothetical protein